MNISKYYPTNGTPETLVVLTTGNTVRAYLSTRNTEGETVKLPVTVEFVNEVLASGLYS